VINCEVYLQGRKKVKGRPHTSCGQHSDSLIWVYVTDYKYLFGYVI